jgi:hypothetical protein
MMHLAAGSRVGSAAGSNLGLSVGPFFSDFQRWAMARLCCTGLTVTLVRRRTVLQHWKLISTLSDIVYSSEQEANDRQIMSY